MTYLALSGRSSAALVGVDTDAGPVHVEWDPDAAVTPLGHLAFFADYLKMRGRFETLMADCPLTYTSPNAPPPRDVVGTAMLAILAGQWRYAHMTALCGDTVNPPLLGMTRVVSEDAVRRGLARIPGPDGAAWLCGHLDDTNWSGRESRLRLRGWSRSRAGHPAASAPA